MPFHRTQTFASPLNVSAGRAKSVSCKIDRQGQSSGVLIEEGPLLPIILGMLAAAHAPTSKTTETLCEVGRAALRDLPPIDRKANDDVHYGGTDPHHHGLLDVCPQLRTELPEGYSLADEDANKRASVHIPLPGKPPKWAGVYNIDIPELAADGKSATVHYSFECTGLCGAGFESRYVLTREGWQRDGKPRTLWVS